MNRSKVILSKVVDEACLFTEVHVNIINCLGANSSKPIYEIAIIKYTLYIEEPMLDIKIFGKLKCFGETIPNWQLSPVRQPGNFKEDFYSDPPNVNYPTLRQSMYLVHIFMWKSNMINLKLCLNCITLKV